MRKITYYDAEASANELRQIVVKFAETKARSLKGNTANYCQGCDIQTKDGMSNVRIFSKHGVKVTTAEQDNCVGMLLSKPFKGLQNFFFHRLVIYKVKNMYRTP